MTLKAKELTKLYGKQRAVDHISFEAREGEITGLLGPNGAGKSTTMKIATCYLPPSSGDMEIYGHSIHGDTLAVRRLIGYLPEHNPLYHDMYVHEYLNFAGTLYKLKGKKLRDRVKEVVALCGLTVEQNKKIEALSKGYRQRVGLAQALLHDPKTLILDEPTTGLDPNQIVEIRNLIKQVSREKTVILSTHIMQEVQALCDRAIIINKGRIVADGLIADLQKEGNTVIFLEFSEQIDAGMLKEVAGVSDVKETSPGNYQLSASGDQDVRSAIFRLAAEKNLPLIGLKQDEKTMESIFRQLTQEEKS